MRGKVFKNKDKIKRLLELWEAVNNGYIELQSQVDLLYSEIENEEDFIDKEYLNNLITRVSEMKNSVNEIEFKIEDLGNALNLSYTDI